VSVKHAEQRAILKKTKNISIFPQKVGGNTHLAKGHHHRVGVLHLEARLSLSGKEEKKTKLKNKFPPMICELSHLAVRHDFLGSLQPLRGEKIE
jgi:hypothetical protein